MTESSTVRRVLKCRETGWARKCAAFLQRVGLRPNQISIGSVLFAAGGSVALAFMAQGDDRIGIRLLALGAMVGIQGRLLCNLFDGMVAVEGGLKTRSGELFNDFPDRISDSLLLVGAGIACGSQIGLIGGFVCALLAVLTAYVRVLCGAAGGTQAFLGPMAKQHRMALLTVAMAAIALLPEFRQTILFIALVLIAVGSSITVIRRLVRGYRELEGAL